MEEIQFPLLELVDELVIEVFEQLYLLSEHSLRSCSAACHRFYRLAVPILYRRVTVKNDHYYRDRSPSLTTQRLCKDGSRLPSFVREAIFDDRYKYGNSSGKPFVQFLSKAKNLRKITWLGSYHIPRAVLMAVKANVPQVQIKLDSVFPPEENDYYEGWGTSVHRMSGFASQQLHSLHIGAFCDDNFKEMENRCISQIVTGCHNLRIMSQFFSPMSLASRMPFELDIRRTHRMPRLESLCWINLSPSTLDVMTSLGAWRNLKVLKLDGTRALKAFETTAPLLETLAVYFRSEDPAELSKLNAPLRKITLFGHSSTRIPVDFLRHYGDTLTELRLRPHQPEIECLQAISPSDMRTLAVICPKLHVLEMNLHSNNQPPCDFLKELVQFPELTTLTLNTDRTLGWRSQNQAPWVTQGLCIDLAKYLQSKKMGVALQTITVSEGYDDKYYNREALGYRPKFNCRLSRNGNISVQKIFVQNLETVPDDYNVFSKMEHLTKELWKRERPFFAEFELAGREDAVKIAKHHGLGREWAERELLPKGLITKEQLERRPRWALPDSRDTVAELERLRQLVKDDLVWLKRRRDFEERHGRYCTLFDILYPLTEG